MLQRFSPRLLIALGAIALAFILAWSGSGPGLAAAPVALSPTPDTPVIGSDAQPFPPGEAGEHFTRAHELAATAIGPQPIIAQLIAGTTLYLGQNGAESESLAQLAELLHLYPESHSPRLESADLDGDGQDDLLVFLDVVGGRGLAFLRDGGSYRGFDLTPTTETEARQFLFGLRTPRLERIADINDDDRLEIITTYELPAVDAERLILGVQAWDGESFVPLFAQLVSDWGGAADWQLVSHSKTEDIVIRYPLIGVFDFRYLPHQTITETWRWAGDAYTLFSQEVSPPETRHQQVNQAEVLFRAGDYERAITAYQRVITGGLRNYRQEVGAPEPNWVGFAQFRQAQCYALLGDSEQADEALAVARRSAAPLSELAWAFTRAYKEKDSEDALVKAFGALYRVRLNWVIHLVNPGNIVFPMEAFPILYPGIGVAAYLDAHADSLEEGGGVLDHLSSHGLPLRTSYSADLDGDGRSEALFVTEDDHAWHAWIAYRQAGEEHWRVGVAYEATVLHLDGGQPLEGTGRQAAILYQEPSAVPPYILLSWDGQQPLRLSPDGQQVLGQGWTYPPPRR
jgi:tetratricopeptide (TPR) repeat protein